MENTKVDFYIGSVLAELKNLKKKHNFKTEDEEIEKFFVTLR